MAERERAYRDNSGGGTHVELSRSQVEEIEIAVKEADAGLFATDKEVQWFFARWTA